LTLRRIWAELLGLDEESLSIDDNFFLNGGHSLSAVSMISIIIRQIGVEIPLDFLFERPTIRTLAEGIADMADAADGRG
jgi:acyl carrier protein